MDDKETRAYIEKLEFENQALRQDMDATIRNAKIFQAECRALEKDNERLGKERDEAIAERDKLQAEVEDLHDARDKDTDQIAGLARELEELRGKRASTSPGVAEQLRQMTIFRDNALDEIARLQEVLKTVRDLNDQIRSRNIALIEERDALVSEIQHLRESNHGYQEAIAKPGLVVSPRLHAEAPDIALSPMALERIGYDAKANDTSLWNKTREIENMLDALRSRVRHVELLSEDTHKNHNGLLDAIEKLEARSPERVANNDEAFRETLATLLKRVEDLESETRWTKNKAVAAYEHVRGHCEIFDKFVEAIKPSEQE